MTTKSHPSLSAGDSLRGILIGAAIALALFAAGAVVGVLIAHS